jgi:hypothetical protein
MKAFIAFCFLLASNVAFSQIVTPPYDPSEGLYWIDGHTVTITYSPKDAPATVSASQMAQVIAQAEARINGLNIPGLRIAVGRLDLPNGCADRSPNIVHVCWEHRVDRRVDPMMYIRTDGSTFWNDSYLLFANNADWTDPTRPLYQQFMHYLLHVLGLAHPRDGNIRFESVINNNVNDLSQGDIDGLRAVFTATRCALSYNASNGTVDVPYVSVGGKAYSAQLQNLGGGNFSVVPGSLSMYSSTKLPLTPCQGLKVDASGEFHVPQVWVGSGLYWATLRLGANNRLTLQGSGR